MLCGKPNKQSRDETEDSSSSEEDEESKYDTTPLFNRTMPGVLTKAEIQTADHDGDLSRIKFQLKGGLYEVGDTVMWDSGSIDDIWTLKGRVADMVTALGLDLANRMFITFE
jgi:arginine-tRNA-protein transferase